MIDNEIKAAALAKHLEVEISELEQSRYDSNAFTVDGAEYRVLTDEEADAEAEDYIVDSVWAFRPSFLAAHSDADEAIFEALQDTDKCESLNKPIKSLIKDWDHFVQDAIKADGRGHFLNTYDGEEIELLGKSGCVEFFAYRVN